MLAHVRANLWLLVLTVLLCSGVYPLVLWSLGQAAFHEQAQGSLLRDATGQARGSRLIAQPFTADEYFHPRPSAAAFNGAASGASNWSANNYLLRDRIARQLGPIVKYAGGPRHGERVGPDIERWFQADVFRDQRGIVAQWATQHPTVAQNWVQADELHTACVARWETSHAAEVAAWSRAHPGTHTPQPADLAGPFFRSYSHEHPGEFPIVVERRTSDGQTRRTLEAARQGREIQAVFFDMWLQAHPHVQLESVPADLVTASGSGLDPHLTLDSARWQLERVAEARARKTGQDAAQLRQELEQLLRACSQAPLGGLAGVPLVNVLEVNLELDRRHASGSQSD